MYVSGQPSLSVRGRMYTDVTGITVWQIQCEKVRFLLNVADHNPRFAKISLCMTRPVS
jgi:hypothetical protein